MIIYGRTYLGNGRPKFSMTILPEIWLNFIDATLNCFTGYMACHTVLYKQPTAHVNIMQFRQKKTVLSCRDRAPVTVPA